jgi:hypothetical protein
VTAVSSQLLVKTVGSLEFESNSALTSINLPFLTFTGSNLQFGGAALSTVDFSSLTYSGGSLLCSSNPLLTSLHLSLLSTLVLNLQIRTNPSLTFASLPNLTFIGGGIYICSNNALFTIPSGPPNAPTGGFVVTGSSKGQNTCHLKQGTNTCSPVNYNTCP